MGGVFLLRFVRLKLGGTETSPRVRRVQTGRARRQSRPNKRRSQKRRGIATIPRRFLFWRLLSHRNFIFPFKKDCRSPDCASAGHTSHIHYDRQDHGLTLGLGVKILRQRVLDICLDLIPFRHAVFQRLFKHVAGNCAHLIHKLLRFADINKSAGNDIRTGNDLAVVHVDRRHDDDKSVLSEMAAVAPGRYCPRRPRRSRR